MIQLLTKAILLKQYFWKYSDQIQLFQNKEHYFLYQSLQAEVEHFLFWETAYRSSLDQFRIYFFLTTRKNEQ